MIFIIKFYYKIKMNKSKSIVCGFHHSVALRSDGNIECWGNNKYNQCDPVYKTFTAIITVACGLYHSVALRSDGTLELWDLIYVINVIMCIKLLLILKV